MLLERLQLGLFKWSAAVSDDAAAAFADSIVAGEIFSDHILCDKDVADLHDGAERILSLFARWLSI